MRDRETILADTSLHSGIWRKTGWPGVVLVAGEVAGIWRPKKNGSTLHLTIEPLGGMSRSHIDAITGKHNSLAPFRGCSRVAVTSA